MVRVMATGVFDLLHTGHLHFLQTAKQLGDELVVVVARDSTVERLKHRPVMNETIRVELIGALKVVDRAVLGHESNHFDIVHEIKPDIIALGYDQFHSEHHIRVELMKRGLEHIRIVRLPKFNSDLNGTRKILRRIISESERFRTIPDEE